MRKLGITPPNQIESRPDIVGMLFCTFQNEDLRDMAVDLMKNARLSYGSSSIWFSGSLPLNLRICQSFFFGMKRLLIIWPFNKQAIRVETEDLSLRINGHTICTVSAEDNLLKIEWTKTWHDWQEMHDDEQYKKLVSSCQSKLMKTRNVKGKGKTSSE